MTKENRNDKPEQADHSNDQNVRFLTDEEIIDAIARDPAFTSISAWTQGGHRPTINRISA